MGSMKVRLTLLPSGLWLRDLATDRPIFHAEKPFMKCSETTFFSAFLRRREYVADEQPSKAERCLKLVSWGLEKPLLIGGPEGLLLSRRKAPGSSYPGDVPRLCSNPHPSEPLDKSADKAFNDVGGFDSGTRFWGSEDSELSMRMWLMGYQVMCDPSMRVGHGFREEHPYHIAWFDEVYNKARFAFSHFSERRLENFLRGNADVPMFLDVLLEIQKSDVFQRRRKLFKTRKRSDDWFFEKFPMKGWG
jgi:hypothetical protein